MKIKLIGTSALVTIEGDAERQSMGNYLYNDPNYFIKEWLTSADNAIKAMRALIPYSEWHLTKE